jgi:hypothetical protein
VCGGASTKSTPDGPGQIAVVAGLEDFDHVDSFKDVEEDAYRIRALVRHSFGECL